MRCNAHLRATIAVELRGGDMNFWTFLDRNPLAVLFGVLAVMSISAACSDCGKAERKASGCGITIQTGSTDGGTP
jgi:hypothetical protein